MHTPTQRSEDLPEIDTAERGRGPDGKPLSSDRRLFMQLLVFDAPLARPADTTELARHLDDHGVSTVLYDDVNNPRGIGVLSWSEDPSDFVARLRPVLVEHGAFALRPELTMLGRTYSTGYESNLDYWLLERPVQTVQNEACRWAVWYPLRRTGAFARLEPQEQGAILREHGAIGRAYAAKDLAHDVRLACHGLDASDNEFVIGLIGKELYPLSHIVQTMRKTRQTSEFIESMGPFFVGRAAHRTARR